MAVKTWFKYSIWLEITILAMVGMVGMAFCSYQAGKIQKLRQQLAGLSRQMGQLQQQQIAPLSENLALLQEKNRRWRQQRAVFMQELQAKYGSFSRMEMTDADGHRRALEPDEWKKKFGRIRECLHQQAASAGIKLPADYDFSFSAYRLHLPPAKDSLPLDIQLLGVEQLSRCLFQARIEELNSIQRASLWTENAAVERKDRDLLRAVVTRGKEDSGQFYPFQLTFTAGPEALCQVMNRIEDAEWIFIIRNLTLENQRQSLPSAAQVRQAGRSDGETTVAAPDQLVVPVLGQELLNIKLNVDLWCPAAALMAEGEDS